MKINKNIEKYLVFSLIITVCVSSFSCDFIDESESDQYNKAENERIKVNIEEAEVLSDVSILNETLIALSQLPVERSSVYPLKAISNKLKKDGKEIRKVLNDLAEKEIILLPTNITNNDFNELIEIDEVDFSKAYLEKAKSLLESEISQLEYLSNITNDVDFKVLTVKILVKLNYNLDQINNILK